MLIAKCAAQVALCPFWAIFEPKSTKNLRPLAGPPLPRLVWDSRSATPLIDGDYDIIIYAYL
jgi:hypothetical protein